MSPTAGWQILSREQEDCFPLLLLSLDSVSALPIWEAVITMNDASNGLGATRKIRTETWDGKTDAVSKRLTFQGSSTVTKTTICRRSIVNSNS